MRSAAVLFVLGWITGAPPPALGADPPPQPLTIRYDGSLDLEAPDSRPGDTKPFRSSQRFVTDGAGRARVDWATWAEGDTAREPQTYLVDGDAVFYRPAPGASWFRLSGERARLGRLQALAGLPDLLLADARRDRTKPPPTVEENRGRLESYLVQRPHPRLGDVWDSVVLTYDEDDLIPQGLTMKLFDRDWSWTLAARRAEVDLGPAADSLLEPPTRFEAEPDGDAGDRGELRLVKVAAGVWVAETKDPGTRTLIVEFADYVAVIEWGAGSEEGDRIVDAVQRRWRRKPIRYAFFSHHHPPFVGGIRAAVAAGAAIVTTPGNVGVVRRAAHATFRLEPDRLAKKPAEPQIRTFTDRFEIEDATNRLVAINYGPRSLHTDEFTIFWLPRQRILFEAELGWVGTGPTLRAGRRAGELLAYLAESRLDVDTVIQAWPTRGTDRSLTRTQLEALVRGDAP